MAFSEVGLRKSWRRIWPGVMISRATAVPKASDTSSWCRRKSPWSTMAPPQHGVGSTGRKMSSSAIQLVMKPEMKPAMGSTNHEVHTANTAAWMMPSRKPKYSPDRSMNRSSWYPARIKTELRSSLSATRCVTTMSSRSITWSMFSRISAMTASITRGVSSRTRETTSSRTYTGSAVHRSGAYTMATSVTIVRSIFCIMGSSSSATRAGSTREKTSFTSMRLSVSSVMALRAILAALDGTIPCHPRCHGPTPYFTKYFSPNPMYSRG
mmetsp:Transcript_878/g.2737  ORF Transcript_878/g.2737 Transcript_878/m.2737 type:complete len:267 (+) Transcript_878:264-1064(+)